VLLGIFEMNLDELNTLWAKDCKIDETNLVRESSRIPELHNKYFMFYVKEVLRVKKLKADHIELEKAKLDYYTGTMDAEDLKSRGWPPFALKVMRADVNKYIESDKEIITLSLKIAYHDSIVKYLEDIIKQINTRNFIIKNMIDWSKFQSGG
jgi:hypothetical protein